MGVFGKNFGTYYGGKENPYQILHYGTLYNWFAATDARHIGNAGWHVPNFNDVWTVLLGYVGGPSVAGNKLKEVGSVYWQTAGGTNIYSFNARAAGRRTNTGAFLEILLYNIQWITDYFDATHGGYWWFHHASASVTMALNGSGLLKTFGSSIRLVKDVTTLSHGQSGIYTGNDGQKYRTICIGTQEWIADNLAETKYRNGDAIPEISDDSAWAALSTGGMCYYNNDVANK